MMNLPWRLFSSFLLLSMAAATAAALSLGAIINPDSQVGREQRVAIEVAVGDFNSSASPLFLTIINSTDLGGAAATVESLKRSRRKAVDVAVILGAGTWSEETIAAEVGNKAQLPIIAFPAAPSSSPATSWPYLLRMPGHVSSQLRCITELVGDYSWRRVIAIYEDADGLESVSPTTLSLFSSLLRGVSSDVEAYRAFPRHDSLPNPGAVIREGLTELNSSVCRVFVLLGASSRFADDLFKEATALGMMEEGYVWIANDGATTGLNPSILQGVVEIRSYVETSRPSYGNFVAKFQRRFREEYGTEGEPPRDGVATPGIFALLAYDAVHAIAAATSNNNNDSSGSNMVRAISTSAAIHGLSGRIRFGAARELLANGTVTLRITNVVGSGRREMGFWTEGKGFHPIGTSTGTSSAKDVFGSVHWPGGRMGVPGGWDVLDVIYPMNTTFEEFVKVEVDQNNSFMEPSGFCIDVFKEAIRRLPYKLRVRYHPFEGGYDSMVEQVHVNKTYYAVVGDITTLADRLKYGDFTAPFMDSSMAKVTTVRKAHNAWIFLKPFTWKLWLVIILASLYTGIIVSFLERRANPGEYSSRWGISTGMWFAFSTFFSTQGRLYSSFAKVAIIVWLFVALVLTQSYTASLTSILTVQKLEPERHSTNVGCDGDSFIAKYLQTLYPYKKENIVELRTEKSFPEAFKNGSIAAAYMETPYLRVFLASHDDDYILTGDSVRVGGFGFLFRKGSPITADVSQAILTLTKDGTLVQLRSRYFTVDLFSCPKEDKGTSKNSLDLDSFWLLFLLSGLTSTIVFLLFLIHLLRKTPEPDRSSQARVAPLDVDQV